MFQGNEIQMAEDPDPITIGLGLITIASFAIQLYDRRSSAGKVVSSTGAASVRNQRLLQLQAAARETMLEMDRVIRAVELGSRDSEDEFFEAPFRVSQRSMHISPDFADEYSNALIQFYGKIGILSLKINNIIFEDPELAARIGAMLADPLAGMPDRINNLLSNAGSHREAVQVARQTLEALQAAINAAFPRRN
ncbi:MAG: hypothetical protein WBR13_12245 [Allosphingosinicella sp.]